MYNPQRTLEQFGYDLKSLGRRTKEQVAAMGNRKPKDMPVVDNCPTCNEERIINLNQSRKNKACSKCFHNTPEMKAVKLAQKGCEFTVEHKEKLKANHWVTKGMEPAFKGKTHTRKAKESLRKQGTAQYENMADDEFELHRVKSSLQRGRTMETFNGFSAPEGTRIRQSAEGKAWTYDILSKANFTCIKCNTRGGQLHAHHKNAFNSYPEQRFDIDNGVCLCYDCHEKFHEVYGKGNNTKEQFEQWLSVK